MNWHGSMSRLASQRCTLNRLGDRLPEFLGPADGRHRPRFVAALAGGANLAEADRTCSRDSVNGSVCQRCDPLEGAGKLPLSSGRRGRCLKLQHLTIGHKAGP